MNRIEHANAAGYEKAGMATWTVPPDGLSAFQMHDRPILQIWSKLQAFIRKLKPGAIAIDLSMVWTRK